MSSYDELLEKFPNDLMDEIKALIISEDLNEKAFDLFEGFIRVTPDKSLDKYVVGYVKGNGYYKLVPVLVNKYLKDDTFYPLRETVTRKQQIMDEIGRLALEDISVLDLMKDIE